MEQKKIDWYLRFAWLIIFVSVMLIGIYYTLNNINHCTSQPLNFAVDQIKQKFEVSLVYGRVTMMDSKANYDYIDFGDINLTTDLESTSKINFNTSLP